jgi:hypothetical protein
MDLGKNITVRLSPDDEYTHPIEAAQNFNESMYINLFDHSKKMGGWFRVGNRPNEGYAEISCCVYLPDGRVAFMFDRPRITTNERIAAGGMAFDIVEPFKKLVLSYEGKVCVLKNPQDMENPKKAFVENPPVACSIRIEFTGASPVFGGEALDEHGHPIEEHPDESFARAHYEQHMQGGGEIKIADEVFTLSGLGLRDHSWGPRYWQNLYWYRWMPMNFTKDFALNVSIVQMASGRQHVWGMVLRDGHYELLENAEISSVLDENNQAIAQTIKLRAGGKEYTVEGKSISCIPLRNRRQRDDGSEMRTRITEAFTEYRCNGLVGYGMAEYLDQMVDGLPVGMHC